MPSPSVSSVPDTALLITDADVDALLAEFGHDPRMAIRALLHDLAILAEDRDNSVSFGYVRGRLYAQDAAVRNNGTSARND